MLRNFRALILLALAALAWNVTPAYSTSLTTYTSLANWQAATTADLLADFEGLTPPGTSTSYNSATGVSNYSNVEFIGYSSGGSSDIQVIDTTISPFFNFGTGDALVQTMDRPNSGSPLPYIHVQFLTPVTAFGGNLFTASSNGMNFSVTINGASNIPLATPYTVGTNAPPNPVFWGVTSDTPIWSIDLSLQGSVFNGSSYAFLDNVEYGMAQGSSSDTPEAATLILIGSGLIGLALFRKRIKPTQPA
jgi:hypothetical protein